MVFGFELDNTLHLEDKYTKIVQYIVHVDIHNSNKCHLFVSYDADTIVLYAKLVQTCISYC